MKVLCPNDKGRLVLSHGTSEKPPSTEGQHLSSHGSHAGGLPWPRKQLVSAHFLPRSSQPPLLVSSPYDAHHRRGTGSGLSGTSSSCSVLVGCMSPATASSSGKSPPTLMYRSSVSKRQQCVTFDSFVFNPPELWDTFLESMLSWLV